MANVNSISAKVMILEMIVVLLLSPCGAIAMRVACVGDSDTAGFGLQSANSYPSQLERILKQTDERWEARNFGYSGGTVINQGDMPYTRHSMYNSALAYEPDVVVFQFGGNASRSQNRGYIQEHFLSDYVDLIQAFVQLPSKPKILICQPLAVFSSNWTISPTIIRDQIVPLTAQVASTWDAPIVDFYSISKDSPGLLQSDKIHPTTECSRIMAEMVASMILGIRWSPDFNSDSLVDIDDLIILIDHWGQNEPSLDIAPVPSGDGTIDVLDLEALMSYWGREVFNPNLIAHWKLDEVEGNIAFDSARENDATVSGDAVWMPDDCQINGGIQLNGTADYIKAPHILDPAEGEFSMFVWIKGGAPGQVILSQENGANLLMADIESGTFRADISDPMKTSRVGTSGGLSLISTTIITDGNWHRVGLTWDGTHRILFVDDVEVSRDTLAELDSSNGGFYIGTGSVLEPGTFWSGMIDDVRIYDRVVTP
jgi:acyl-CoA thioesterase I